MRWPSPWPTMNCSSGGAGTMTTRSTSIRVRSWTVCWWRSPFRSHVPSHSSMCHRSETIFWQNTRTAVSSICTVTYCNCTVTPGLIFANGQFSRFINLKVCLTVLLWIWYDMSIMFYNRWLVISLVYNDIIYKALPRNEQNLRPWEYWLFHII